MTIVKNHHKVKVHNITYKLADLQCSKINNYVDIFMSSKKLTKAIHFTLHWHSCLTSLSCEHKSLARVPWITARLTRRWWCSAAWGTWSCRWSSLRSLAMFGLWSQAGKSRRRTLLKGVISLYYRYRFFFLN